MSAVLSARARHPLVSRFGPEHMPRPSRMYLPEKAVWATQPRNEQKLNAAFNEAEAVILFFSVNESRAFQGYARMASRTGEAGTDEDVSALWTGAEGDFKAPAWGSTFKVKWQTIYDLSFNDVMHLRNPYNEDKPIKISRDGQEVEPSVGRQLCLAIDEGCVAHSMA